jgi:hypothetical protein
MGRADYYKEGTWNALCDRCSFKYKADELKKEWTGLMVCPRCWEPRHEQEFLKGHKDELQVPWSRPDTSSDDTEYNGDEGKTLAVDSNYDIQNWNTELTKDRVVILDSTNARAGDRFTIYKTKDDDNTLYITTTTLDSGNSV